MTDCDREKLAWILNCMDEALRDDLFSMDAGYLPKIQELIDLVVEAKALCQPASPPPQPLPPGYPNHGGCADD